MLDCDDSPQHISSKLTIPWIFETRERVGSLNVERLIKRLPMLTQVVGQLEDSGGYPFETIIDNCYANALDSCSFFGIKYKMITRFVLSYFFFQLHFCLYHSFVELSLIQ